jgi:TRAP-type mannitol/chloroaromatic compound transport system, small permease component
MPKIHHPHAWVRAIDRINDFAGSLAKWALLAACLISGLNAIVRYSFGYSSNAWLEVQWYLFAVGVMLGAPQVLRLNEHVRVDVFYGNLKPRRQVWVDLLGLVLFLVPVMGLFALLSWPMFTDLYASGEVSPNAGGLIRWPVMLTLPLGFTLLVLQGVAEISKRILWLKGRYSMDTHYEKPLQ